MPACNLLYVAKDNVFNCYDRITGYTKKQYVVSPNAIPAINDVLLQGTILVLPSHSGGAEHLVTFDGQGLTVTQYAQLVLNQISYAQRITKIVYLICSANATVADLEGKRQLAPNALLTYSVAPTPLLTVSGNTGLSPNTVVGLDATNQGFIYH